MKRTNQAFWICAQTGVVPLAEGDPGTSKTKTGGAFAKAVGRHFISVRPSSLMPEDLGGYPHLVDGKFRISPPFFVEEINEYLAKGIHSVVLFDELTTCPSSKQAPLLNWTEEGKLDAWVIAVCNPHEIAADGQPLEPPLVNRFCVLEWEQDHATWRQGLLTGWPDQSYPILPSNWRSFIMPAAALVAEYTRVRPEHWQACPKDRSEACKPWPSQRSWTNVATLLGAASACTADDLIANRLTAGCVGKYVADEFFTWKKEQDLGDPEELLADPKSYRTADRPDKVWAILAGVVGATLRDLTVPRWTAAMEVMGKAAEDYVEIATVNAEVLMNGPGVSSKNGYVPPRSVSKIMLPVMKRVGW